MENSSSLEESRRRSALKMKQLRISQLLFPYRILQVIGLETLLNREIFKFQNIQKQLSFYFLTTYLSKRKGSVTMILVERRRGVMDAIWFSLSLSGYILYKLRKEDYKGWEISASKD